MKTMDSQLIRLHFIHECIIKFACCTLLLSAATTGKVAAGELSSTFYDSSCPDVISIVRKVVAGAIQKEARMAASLVRLHFHDCFVHGCDGSILLDDTADFKGEKTAGPNLNSARGFDVIDDIKTEAENNCPGIVSCADILTMAARDSVELSGGPCWTVLLGRQDSKSASLNAANTEIPGPSLTAAELGAKFQSKGLSLTDMVTLSGAHTLGKAHCNLIENRFRNFNGTGTADPAISSWFVRYIVNQCSNTSDGSQLVLLDSVTPTKFDNRYYENLIGNMGVLSSDQVLFSTEGDTKELVKSYCGNQSAFFNNFVTAMLKLGNLQEEEEGEIRKNCHVRNS
ncbi:hypothetical protein O6H91_19G036200 [Diphasiastrum complanatum]|uniref:Uncharacterized protein n=1 Tax=Diphasiastrum complanatum TaxID=34168 RepID=A0ACC2AUC5_DIPCM|nr:hypothetical protein O6H91_19G036200 [Diphasiastrum complanatum]